MQGKPVQLCMGLFLPRYGPFLVPRHAKIVHGHAKNTTLLESGRDCSNLAPFSPLEQGTYMALARAAVESLFFSSLCVIGLSH
jgi:hypothetical protein